MLASLFSSTTIPVLGQVVNFAQSRHEVLSGNLANIDTPGYRTRDLNTEVFEGKLKQAIADSHRAGSPVSAGSPATDRGFSEVRDSLKSILYHDGTNIGIEQQIAEISKNQMQHNLALTVLTQQFQLLEAAIGEKA